MLKIDDEGRARVMLGDCIKNAALFARADAVITDPPYGIRYRVNARTRHNTSLDGIADTSTAAAPMIEGDHKPFDPAPWMKAPRLAFFGAQHFADRLPVGSWIVWDKRRDSASDDHSDGDVIWTNGRHPLRIHRQKWRGVVREGEENCSRSKKLHPNQKPVALLDFIIDTLGLKPGALIADPFMGSGSTGVAALRRGMRFMGCEIDPEHFDTAARRLSDEASGMQMRLALAQ